MFSGWTLRGRAGQLGGRRSSLGDGGGGGGGVNVNLLRSTYLLAARMVREWEREWEWSSGSGADGMALLSNP